MKNLKTTLAVALTAGLLSTSAFATSERPMTDTTGNAVTTTQHHDKKDKKDWDRKDKKDNLTAVEKEQREEMKNTNQPAPIPADGKAGPVENQSPSVITR